MKKSLHSHSKLLRVPEPFHCIRGGGRARILPKSTGMRSSPGNSDPPQQSSGLAEWEITEQTWQNTVLSSNLGLDQGSLPRPLLSPSQDKGLDPSITQRSGGRAGVCHRIQPLTSDSSPGQDILYLPSGKCGEGRFGVALNGTLLRTPVLKFLCPKNPLWQPSKSR